jgi:nucleoside-diphosphate-sugar epimerase
MRVLVIGGTRFVGPRVVRILLARGHEVTTFNRGRTPDPSIPGVERLHGDRTDGAQLVRALGDRSFDGCVDTIAMRGADTTGAVETLHDRVGHYVHFSTGQVYLVREGCPTPAREEDYDGPIMPAPGPEAWDIGQWEYGVEKRECEDVLERAWRERAFPATRLRLTMVHGIDDPHGRIRTYVRALLGREPLRVPSEPTPPVRPIHADAVADAVAGILESGRGKGAAFNLAQAETWTHSELVDRIAGLLGVEPRLDPRPREELIRSGVFPACAPLANSWMSVLDPARAERVLGFRPGRFGDWLPDLVERLAARER